MAKVRKKRRDDVDVVVSIPRKLLIEYATEPVRWGQPKSDCRRWVEGLFREALFDKYLEIGDGERRDA
jgi:hypothetical protein